MTSLAKIASYLENATALELPRDVVNHTKLVILDYLGVAIAGAREPAASKASQYVSLQGPVQEAGVIGTGNHSSAELAAWCNGFNGAILELDDIHRGSYIHPSIVTVPAALAVGEAVGANGRTLIRAVALGYEIATRIGQALGESHYQHWHGTGTSGTIAATVSAGLMRGLTQEEWIHALGFACTQAAGLRESFGTHGKPLHSANASMLGVRVTSLAQLGFRASPEALDGERGLFRATGAAHRLPYLAEQLAEMGTSFRILSNSFKCHPTCGATHATLDLIDVLTSRRSSDEVASIHIGLCEVDYSLVGRATLAPDGFEAAQFNLLYLVAAAICNGGTLPENLTLIDWKAPCLEEVARKISITVDPEIQADSHLSAAEAASMTLVTRSGQTVSRRKHLPLGGPGNPLSTEQIAEKFRKLALRGLPSWKVDILFEKVNLLENVVSLQQVARAWARCDVWSGKECD